MMERSIGEYNDAESVPSSPRVGAALSSSNAYSNISSTLAESPSVNDENFRRLPVSTNEKSGLKSNKAGNKSSPISDRSYMNGDDI